MAEGGGGRSALAHHDAAHATMAALGDLSARPAPGDAAAHKAFQRRLGAATKAGMKAIAEAQAANA